MTDPTPHDEQLLIDYLLGRCDEAQTQAVQRRIAEDAAFRALHRDLRNALGAMALIPVLEPPADLAERTIHRMRQVRATEALIARAEMARRPASRSRFSLRELAAVASVVLLMGLGFYLTLGRSVQARQLAALCEARLGDIGKAAHMYAANNGGAMPVSVRTTRRRRCSSARPSRGPSPPTSPSWPA
jgi:anti-sigma-K factor RskA